MKQFLITWFIIFCINAIAQNKTAQDYYDFLLQEETAVGEELVKLTKMLSSYDGKMLHEQLAVVINRLNVAVERVENEEAFSKSKYLKNAFLDYLEVLKHLCKNDFKELVDVISKENITESDKHSVYKTYGKIIKHIAGADELLSRSRATFAEKNHLHIQTQPFRFYLEQTKW